MLHEMEKESKGQFHKYRDWYWNRAPLRNTWSSVEQSVLSLSKKIIDIQARFHVFFNDVI